MEAWIAFAREFGLPLSMLAAFAWAILKRKLVTGAEVEGWKALYERERADRIAAQEATGKVAAKSADLAEAIEGFHRTVLARSDPYGDRLGGERGR